MDVDGIITDCKMDEQSFYSLKEGDLLNPSTVVIDVMEDFHLGYAVRTCTRKSGSKAISTFINYWDSKEVKTYRPSMQTYFSSILSQKTRFQTLDKLLTENDL